MTAHNTWTIQSTLDWTQDYLAGKGDENPRLSAQWLLSEVTGLSRIELYAHFDRPLSMPERDVLRGYVSRRGAGEPLQYITGEIGFRHINVKVRSGVLIPRPETEVLVSEALALLPSVRTLLSFGDEASEEEVMPEVSASADVNIQPTPEHLTTESFSEGTDLEPDEIKPLLVADLCTGSGCIAGSLAHENSLVHVIATDIAPAAVELAQENVAALGLTERVEVLLGDLGSAISDERMGTFDLVVSNPPYIPTTVLKDIPVEVGDFEPSLALDGGEDGLDIFRPLLLWSKKALKPGASLVVELHETCLDEAAQIAQEAGFGQTRVVCDLADRPRVLVATLQ